MKKFVVTLNTKNAIDFAAFLRTVDIYPILSWATEPGFSTMVYIALLLTDEQKAVIEAQFPNALKTTL